MGNQNQLLADIIKEKLIKNDALDADNNIIYI